MSFPPDSSATQANRPGLFAELKRRNIYLAALAYLAAASLLLQAAWIFLIGIFQLPMGAMKIAVGVMLLGFPLFLVVAWSFKITSAGVNWRDDVWPNNPARQPATRLVRATVILAAGAVGLLILQIFQFVRAPGAIGGSPIESLLPSVDKSIAVLPFENWSEDTTNDFFTDAVQDEILTGLAKIAELKVIGRTSAMQYRSRSNRNIREIGRELGVAHVLEGSVDRSDDRVRVHVQLVDARNDAHLWAEIYDQELVDVFKVQADIVKSVANQLQVRLNEREKTEIERPPTSNLRAHDLYCRASMLIADISPNVAHSPKAKQAIELLQEATALEPDFYAAYVQLASVQETLYFFGWDRTPARRAELEQALQTLSRLRPDDGETHYARAFHFYHDLDYEQARAELKLVTTLLPNDSRVPYLMAVVDRRQGRWEESVQNFRKAVELDPRNVTDYVQLINTYASMRRYREETAELEQMFRVHLDNVDMRAERGRVELMAHADPGPLHNVVHRLLAQNKSAASDLTEYWFLEAFYRRDAADARQALAALPPDGWSLDNALFPHPFAEALVAGLENNETARQAALNRARDEVMAKLRTTPDFSPDVAMLGLIEAQLGDKEEAIRAGESAVKLTPLEKESVFGALVVRALTYIYAWTGEKDRAFEQLNVAARVPGGFRYGELKLDPFLDPLRGDSRFEKIVASLAPKKS